MNEIKTDYSKWFRVLIYIAVAGLINVLVGMPSFVPAAATTWVSRFLMAVTVYAMFKLAPANDRYKKAAVQRTIVLAITIITEFMQTAAVLTLIAGILSVVAEYQEYHAHAETVEEKDHRLSGKWTGLFMWSIVVGLVLGFASTAAGILAAVAGIDAEKAAVMITGIIMIPEFVIDILYILYLKKTAVLLSEK